MCLADDKSKEVIINVNAKDFMVKCNAEFASQLEADIDLLSYGTKKIELKNLVDNFVKKSYENYTLKKELEKLLKNINKELS